MTSATGQRLGPYEILGKLGRGGMGLIFRAWDGRLQREVAIKLLHNEYPMAGTRERFLQEARAASALNHPNICTIFDIGEKDGAPYLVMELMEGETLKERIDSGAVRVDEIVQFSREVSDALGAAHARGIIHRDIKPANIFLVEKPGGGHQAKVLDFGLAKVNHEVYGALAPKMKHKTSDGATVGTVAYMSPEQARGEALDARTDLFSLGVVMYEMATRRVPFHGNTSALAYVQLLNHQPEPVRDWNDAIPRDLEKIILKLLAKNAVERYQTAAELSTALTKLREKGSGSWLKRAAQVAVPLVRASDPVARAKRPVKRQSGPQLVEPQNQNQPQIPARTSRDDGATVLRPVVQLADRLPSVKAEAAQSTHPTENALHSPTEDDAAKTAQVTATAPAGAAPDASPADSGEAIDLGQNAAPPAPEPPPPLPSDPVMAILRSSKLPAVGKVAEGRPAAVETGDDAPRPGRVARMRRRRIAVVTAALVFLLIAAGFWLMRRNRLFGKPMLTGSDRLLIAGIDNQTGDKTLDGTVAQGIEIELHESPYLAVRGYDLYRSAVLQLGSVVDRPPTQALARQAAQKAGAKAYLYGVLRTAGGAAGAKYTISVMVVDVATDRTLSSVDESVASREQIPQAIDRVVETLRASLGERADSIAHADVPLDREATANVDALHAYAQGDAALLDGRTDDALAAYQTAAQLDPKFIQTQLRLAWLYRAEHAEMAAAAAARSAAAAAASASSYTSLLAQYAFELNATGDLARAEAAIRKFRALYPHDAAGAESLACVLRLEGRFSEALDAAQRGIAEDPAEAGLYAEGELALIALDRYDAALSLEERSQQLALAHDGEALTAAYLSGKDDRLSSSIERVTRPPRRLSSMAAYGLYLDNTGQLETGKTLWQATAVADPPRPAPAPGDPAAAGNSDAAPAAGGPSAAEESATWLLAQGALDRALANDCDSAMAMVHGATSSAQGLDTSFRAGAAAGLCGDQATAERMIAVLTAGPGQSALVNGYYLPNLRAAEAIGQQDYQSALAALTPAAVAFHFTGLTPYLRGAAYAGMDQTELAIVDFQTALAHRGVAVLQGSNVYPMAQIALARAYADSGDKSNSIRAYTRFLELWSGSDQADPLRLEAIAAVARQASPAAEHS